MFWGKECLQKCCTSFSVEKKNVLSDFEIIFCQPNIGFNTLGPNRILQTLPLSPSLLINDETKCLLLLACVNLKNKGMHACVCVTRVRVCACTHVFLCVRVHVWFSLSLI